MSILLDLLASVSFHDWFLQSLAMLATTLIIPGLRVTSIFGPFIAVLALAFLNTHVWDAALFFQLPNSPSLQTLFLFLANGVIFWILVKLLPGIEVSGILPALFAPVVFTICSVLISIYGDQVDWAKMAQIAIDFLQQLKVHFLETAPDQTLSVLPEPL